MGSDSRAKVMFTRRLERLVLVFVAINAIGSEQRARKQNVWQLQGSRYFEVPGF